MGLTKKELMVRVMRLLALLALINCNSSQSNSRKPVQLITLDPGHFHAALVQKSMYDNVDPTVHVYAPAGNDLNLHMNRIGTYNKRAENPTKWNEKKYAAPDFLEKMVADKQGNVVMLSGNNQRKTEYILKSLESGFHVLADKPMVISQPDFKKLLYAFEIAKEKNLLLYDIMTERFEITTILQRELSQMPAIFGELQKGTPENPAITKESVHHFYKYVSGNVLTRPAWFMDVSQQGEGLVDVMTHLVDLVQWECFPGQTLDTTQVQIHSASRWTTSMTQQEFSGVTQLDSFPGFLLKDANKDTLQIYCNGEINYALQGVHARTSVIWKYRAPEGGADTHYSIMRGSKANLIIQQGLEENFKPTLFIEQISDVTDYETNLMAQLEILRNKYPGIDFKRNGRGWTVEIPDSYRVGHEAHFSQVMERFLQYFEKNNMPSWEVPNMIVKYYTTTQALASAKKNYFIMHVTNPH
jgi:predicted dehydrogenase